ncbi:Major facilitator superfamily domain-containing protein 5 [Monoraphidium neglectum]|uniref:Molybdate-anion transporter n=1 Tax=Monoraphidium neglectum TaxID=145388 RepID=A0A0D2KAH5_9CHLO|nr:Major facilitator superfamily domain-containing protein 5 [Monoraphidium neglectum]KIZ07268.1 Major facilitator superfamily domain-containing protein 5 [Monoraphidium neglectum]|eukprot:XP_013906287.1 Major facilitator superfamily domain-containing protein 5 [Monoraphidium neglectum]
MEDAFYYIVWSIIVLPLTALCWKEGIAAISDNSQAFKAFRNNYLAVYSLQGPYVYALYEHYGYSPAQIGQLFIAGFGSSMVFGTFVGALADKLGRKNAALGYVVTYSLSCCTKHSPDYWVLMGGRVLGGIATSLLYSAFESWLVAEHFKRGYSEQALGQTFSYAVFLGNGLMAILAGFLGDYLVEKMGLGRVAPFDAAILFMVVGGILIAITWPENYGDTSSHDLSQQFTKAWDAITKDPCIALLGAIQAMFEAAMYSFVFLWTMAMSPNKEAIKHGLIFVNFMTASMMGSFLAGVLMKRARPEYYMKYVFGAATAALLVPMVMALDTSKNPELKGKPITHSGKIQLIAFCVFETCVGVFWPSMMKMRSDYVPEELRATIINIFRVPLNLFVCVVLGNVEAFPLAGMFGLCVAFMVVSMVSQTQLDKFSQARPVYHKVSEAADAEESGHVGKGATVADS